MLGLYHATRDKINGKGEGMVFCRYPTKCNALWMLREVELHAKIICAPDRVVQEKVTREFVATTALVETTVGRALLSEILPKGLAFSNLNKALKKKEISKLINASFRQCGLKDTVVFADKLLQNGFRLATRAGFSVAIDDMLVPPQKADILARAESEVKEIEQQYVSGLVTSGERYNKVVDIWGKAGDDVSKVMMDQLKVKKSSTATATKSIRSRSTPST